MVFLLYKYSPCATGWECQKTRVWLVVFERIVAVCNIPLIPKKRRKGEYKGTPVSPITNPEENPVQISSFRDVRAYSLSAAPAPINHQLLAYRLLATGYRLPAFSYWLLATGYWLLATGYWLLATGY
jgi:hypothetical protein